MRHLRAALRACGSSPDPPARRLHDLERGHQRLCSHGGLLADGRRGCLDLCQLLLHLAFPLAAARRFSCQRSQRSLLLLPLALRLHAGCQGCLQRLTAPCQVPQPALQRCQRGDALLNASQREHACARCAWGRPWD